MHPVLAVVLRVVALLLALQVPLWGLEAASDGRPIGIGGIFLAFLATALVALVWAAVDAGRGRPGVVFLEWAVVAALVGAGATLWAQGWPLRPNLDEARSDLIALSPFVAGVVGVPALVGMGAGLLARQVARRRGAGSAVAGRAA